MPFYYSVSWSEVNTIRLELNERYIPYDVTTQSSGEVVFVFQTYLQDCMYGFKGFLDRTEYLLKTSDLLYRRCRKNI